METEWKEKAKTFFDTRSAKLTRKPTIQDLCFVSGRDERIWCDDKILTDLVASILTQTNSNNESVMLEVGCAAGFIANILSIKLRKYVGVDISEQAIMAAKKLKLKNAEFIYCDASVLPFSEGYFSSAICYDVVTNFPNFDTIESIICNMIKVVKPGGKVMIGSVPNGDMQDEYQSKVSEYTSYLERSIGPRKFPDFRSKFSFKNFFSSEKSKPFIDEGRIVCYYFQISEFEQLAQKLGCTLEILPIHSKNPYADYRFNAVFTVPEQ